MANCVSDLTTNINLGCASLTAGAVEVYVLNYKDFNKVLTQTGIDVVGNVNKLIIPSIEVVTPLTDFFWKIESPKGVVASSSEATKNEQNRTFAITQTVVFNVYTDALKSTTKNMMGWLQTLLTGTFLVVVKNADGSYSVIGFDNGATVTAAPFANGVASGDLQAYTITMVASAETSPMRYLLDGATFQDLVSPDTV